MIRLDLNQGDRPSRLDLERQLLGEADLGLADHLALHRHARELEAARADLPPLDLDRIRPPPSAARPPRRSWRPALLLIPLLAAALALVAVLPEPGANRAKGRVDLDLYVQRGGQAVQVEEGEVLAQGDRVRFAVQADGHEEVVVLSVDGRGRVSLLYPERVEQPPVPVDPDQRGLLVDAVALDDAPGPELFVAVFGPASTAEAVAMVRAAQARGGQAAVASLAQTDPGVAVLSVGKAP
ncbi:DUF4384 domain-containing protein [Myxococcota bacterium]|nr:DUF4384 domain-containing protein [Myxococcota bacterium]